MGESARIVDGCAGPGGWEEGLGLIGRTDVLGVEWDEDACATAVAAGHERVRADVSLVDVAAVGEVEGVVFSPPCPSFSAAGSRLGLSDVDLVVECMKALAAGDDRRAEFKARCKDERSILTVEPLRWVLALRPEWVALEQVPAVLGIWRELAALLEGVGYRTWCGKLHAEEYGVPQTRTRAVLLASRTRAPGPPRATHQRYRPGVPREGSATLEGEILPWVSMADALGWGMTERPYPAVACSSSTGGPDKEKVGGSGARKLIYDERAAGRWVHERPATTVCGDPRFFAPGWRGAPRDYDADGTYIGKRSGDNAIRVSLEEAAVLQSFRPDYPWRGNRSQRFRQVGNAVPPLMAAAILREAIG